MSESLNPMMVPPQAYVTRSGSGHGSVGPVIGILAMITVLTIIAIIIGRLCSGRRVMGRVGYDLEGWVETKCASCVDGRVTPPPPPPCGEGPAPRSRRPLQHVEEAMPSGGGELENSRASSLGEETSTRGSGRDEREKGNGRARPGPHDPSENV